jgi:hypothetical protein
MTPTAPRKCGGSLTAGALRMKKKPRTRRGRVSTRDRIGVGSVSGQAAGLDVCRSMTPVA